MGYPRANSEKHTDRSTVVLIGGESVGKSQLIASLTGGASAPGNFRGTTISCSSFQYGSFLLVDTPGILRDTDTLTTKLALDELERASTVLLVVKATHLDQELDQLLPIVAGRQGAIVVTFWDRARKREGAATALASIEEEASVPMIPVDARNITDADRERILDALEAGGSFPDLALTRRAGWTIEPRRGLFDVPGAGAAFALALLFGPAWLAVATANAIADHLYDPVAAGFETILARVLEWPALFRFLLAGDYGVLAMGPFLLLYAVPTVIFFALIQGLYKTTGLVDRITVSINPLVRPLGLAGRDLVRVIMGFGCNVPAVINTRACSTCSRGNCISAISFGSACSYQLPATAAVFAAAGMPELTPVYLLILAVSTAIYLRLTVSKASRLASNRLSLVGRDFLQWPTLRGMAMEVRGVVWQFFNTALPVFFVICIVAEGLRRLGVLAWLSQAAAPLMALFRLPGEASVAIVLGSVRKDGIAIGLLDDGWQTLKVEIFSPVQVLTVVYLAGVLLPCVVTLLTIVREMSPRFAWKMVGRQIVAASVFSLCIAWIGALLF